MQSIVLTATITTEQAGAALGLRPAAIRLRIKDGTISAVRVGGRFGRWRVHTASVNALLGTPPATAQASSAPSLQATATATEPDTPVFGPDDALHIAQCEMMRYSYIPEHVRLANWILAKYKRFGGAAAVQPTSSGPPAFDPNKAFARAF